ncbi:cytochrome c-type biogenesis protein [Aestuariibacter salexigens]|uniref:cytochrome c-type biogenesis protein n=1 Tax=Aestuariibacter salexigens TaxID=226010 RepID=UPI00042744FC
MNIRLMLLLGLCGLLLTLSLQTFAAEDNYQFETPQQRMLFLDLTAELRCPMCQNQNIADSDAMIAHDMRRKVAQLLKQGYSREQVIDYMKDRYGDFVYYQPPVTAATVWLWALPVIFVLFAALVIARRKSQPPLVDEAERLAKADKLLEKE